MMPSLADPGIEGDEESVQGGHRFARSIGGAVPLNRTDIDVISKQND